MLAAGDVCAACCSRCPNWGKTVFQGDEWTSLRMIWSLTTVCLCALGTYRLFSMDHHNVYTHCPSEEVWFPTIYYHNNNRATYIDCSDKLAGEDVQYIGDFEMSTIWRSCLVLMLLGANVFQNVFKAGALSHRATTSERLISLFINVFTAFYLRMLLVVDERKNDAVAINVNVFDLASILAILLYVYLSHLASFDEPPDRENSMMSLESVEAPRCVTCFCVYKWLTTMVLFLTAAFQVTRAGAWLIFGSLHYEFISPLQLVWLDFMFLFIVIKLDTHIKLDKPSCLSNIGKYCFIGFYSLWVVFFTWFMIAAVRSVFSNLEDAVQPTGEAWSSLSFEVTNCNYGLPSVLISGNNLNLNGFPDLDTSCEVESSDGNTARDTTVGYWQDVYTLGIPFGESFYNPLPYYGMISRFVFFFLGHAFVLCAFLYNQLVYSEWFQTYKEPRQETHLGQRPIIGDRNENLLKFWSVVITLIVNSLMFLEEKDDQTAILPFTDLLLGAMWFVLILWLFSCFQCGERCKSINDVLVFVVFFCVILVPTLCFSALFFAKLSYRGYFVNNMLYIDFVFAAFDTVRSLFFPSAGVVEDNDESTDVELVSFHGHHQTSTGSPNVKKRLPMGELSPPADCQQQSVESIARLINVDQVFEGQGKVREDSQLSFE